MEQTIKNPYHVDHRIYITIIAVSVAALILGFQITLSDVKEAVKNLSYGCITSTVVAWILDCANVRLENKKAASTYNSIYQDLQFSLLDYIRTWAKICAIPFKGNGLENTRDNWFGWYELTKKYFADSPPEHQEALISFFTHQLQYSVDRVNHSIACITAQYHFLTVTGMINHELKSIIEDYKFEFSSIDWDLHMKGGADSFWEFMDAVNADIRKYIGNWKDIRYYNYVRFKPWQNFYSDKEEVLRAIQESKGDQAHIMGRREKT